MPKFAGLCLAALLLCTPASAQERPTLRVATRVLPPLVVMQNGSLGGFSIDLWNSIAERLNVDTKYQTNPSVDVQSLLNMVRDGEADVGISAISITAQRNQEVDFSQPMMNAGLQIMTRGKAESSSPNPLRDLLRILFSPAILVWLGIALLLIVVPAHLIWLVERHHPASIIPNKKYIPGIFYALYWAAGTLATQADQMPRQWFARILAILWMFTGVVFVAFYTAQLTATLTIQKIQGAINGPEDLPGRRIGTTRNSTSVAYLRELKADVHEYALISEAYQALLDEKIDAVVFDAPVLLYYASHGGKGRVQTVGNVFRKEDYGIVFKSGSPLRRQVDGALLSLREDGTYQQLYDKWFAEK